MTCLLGGDERHRDLVHDDDYRWYLITRKEPAGAYRFARSNGKRDLVRIRGVLRDVNGFIRKLIAAIAVARMRRLEPTGCPRCQGRS